jgi:formamidopyrimidine-DNA glycosylase
MPERPDLAYVVPRLADAVVGRTIVGVRVEKPVVLRLAVQGTPDSLLAGRRIVSVRRQLHFVRFGLEPDDVELIVHPMLAGRFQVVPPGGKPGGHVAVAFDLDEGTLLFRDDVQMGKVYVIRRGDTGSVPGLEPVGLDVLDPAVFTLAAFTKLARKRKDQAKLFLLDKAALDSFGNAYADEVLHAAGLHPKARVASLDDASLARLHAACTDVLAGAIAEIERREPPLDEKLRDFLKVRNHKGAACPTCGSTIRTCGVRGHDAFFCPSCQPDRGGRGFVDWRRTS